MRNRYGIYYSSHQYQTVYLKSQGWIEKSRFILARDPICRVCDKNRSTDTHHLTYRNLPHERPEDLIGICRSCHKRLHRHPILGRDPDFKRMKRRFWESKKDPLILKKRKSA